MRFTPKQTRQHLRIVSRFANHALVSKNMMVFNHYLKQMDKLNRELDGYEKMQTLNDLALIKCIRQDGFNHICMLGGRFVNS